MDDSFELRSAIKGQKLAKVIRLLKRHVMPQQDAYFLAIEARAHEILKVLADCGLHLNFVNVWGYTPFVMALKLRDYESARILLEAGADPNARCAFGPPLVFAAANGLMDGVRLLLSMKADVEQRDQAQATPLIRAARAGHEDIIRLLRKVGASVSNVDEIQRTAYDNAIAFEHESAARALLPSASL